MGTRAGLVSYNGGKTETGSAQACCCPHCSDCHVDRTVCPQILLDTYPLGFVFSDVIVPDFRGMLWGLFKISV